MQSHGVASSYPMRTSIPNHSALCFTLRTHTHINATVPKTAIPHRLTQYCREGKEQIRRMEVVLRGGCIIS